MSEHTYINRSDLEAWAELYNLEIIARMQDAKLFVDGKLENGPTIRFTFTMIKTTQNGQFYGRGDDFDTVRASIFPSYNYSLTGKGSRSAAAWTEAKTMLYFLSTDINDH